MTPTEILNTLDKLIPNPKCSLNYTTDYELLIAVMLSAQSTDARVNEVTKTLFKYTLEELSNLDINVIENIIKPVGTQKRKSQYIKKISTILLKECNGKVPHNREFVESLPGIGHKTCNVVFSEIYNEPSIAVDTHVTRVSERLGLSSKGDNVLTIEKKLMTKYPKSSWSRLHLQLVLFGRHYCTSITPRCENCPFHKICNYKKV